MIVFQAQTSIGLHHLPRGAVATMQRLPVSRHSACIGNLNRILAPGRLADLDNSLNQAKLHVDLKAAYASIQSSCMGESQTVLAY